MMTVSDNTATNVLIDLVGLDAVNATMTREGFPAVRLNHKIDFEHLWHDAAHLGVGSPRAFAELMAAILQQRLPTPAGCEDMLRLMDGVGAGERLARYIPYNPYAAQMREQGATAAETGPRCASPARRGASPACAPTPGCCGARRCPCAWPSAGCPAVDRPHLDRRRRRHARPGPPGAPRLRRAGPSRPGRLRPPGRPRSSEPPASLWAAGWSCQEIRGRHPSTSLIRACADHRLPAAQPGRQPR